MKNSYKVLLTLPSFLTFCFTITLNFPTEFKWLTPSMDMYYLQLGALQILTLTQVIVLIKKLWSFQKVKKSIKVEWTWILILFSSISSVIFIWRKVDELEAIN